MIKNANISKKDAIFFCICMAAIGAAYILFSFIFRYQDAVSLTVWGVEFWDCIFSGGGLKNYYSYTFANLRGAPHGAPAGSWLPNLPWIIWEFPVYLFNRSTDTDITNQVCSLWGKMLLLLFLIVMAIYVYKILYLFTKNSTAAMTGMIVSVGGLEVITSIAYAGQDEIVYLTLFIMAIYYFMINRKIPALILSVITVTLFPIMIIPYFYLVVIYNKKIWKMILWLGASLVPSVLFELAYRNDTVYAMQKGESSLMTFQWMMNVSCVSTPWGAISFAAIVFVILAFVSLAIENNCDRDKKAIRVLTIVFVCLCFFMRAQFYRSFLYVPFLAILVFMDAEAYAYKTLLMLVIGICKTFMSFNMDEFYANKYLICAIQNRFVNIPEHFIDITSQNYDTEMYFFKTFTYASLVIIFMLHYGKKKYIIKNYFNDKAMLMIYSFSGLFIEIIYCIAICACAA